MGPASLRPTQALHGPQVGARGRCTASTQSRAPPAPPRTHTEIFFSFKKLFPLQVCLRKRNQVKGASPAPQNASPQQPEHRRRAVSVWQHLGKCDPSLQGRMLCAGPQDQLLCSR